ncbi:phage gp6-like head-tail connector protein [Mameliella alba]|nr:phage gp6-like head-tail connector protein [Antarctobacter heliothermus]MBY6143354.1 phage gp6-like head-tail connector protein [Mameliella alba]MBY6163973.1 phage gp6-like head-tail connector protein [Mameliella alba]MBY6172445.1 phage gp6-like head-tail connector protein [Mameliella alba]MBY6177459.1 phage gp6-like head-tail connector protein [Mameliella alba]
MWLERQTGGGVQLIDLADARDHLRIIETDFDAEIDRVRAASSAVLDVDAEGFGGLGFPLVASQFIAKAGCFSPEVLRLPFPRVTAVDAIKYVAPDGSVGTVDPATYMLARDGRRVRVHLLAGNAWPALADRPDAVRLTFTAGWPDVASVPEDIKAAARMLIGHFFENRMAATGEYIPHDIAIGIDDLTRRYRLWAS